MPILKKSSSTINIVKFYMQMWTGKQRKLHDAMKIFKINLLNYTLTTGAFLLCFSMHVNDNFILSKYFFSPSYNVVNRIVLHKNRYCIHLTSPLKMRVYCHIESGAGWLTRHFSFKTILLTFTYSDWYHNSQLEMFYTLLTLFI